MHQFCFYLDWAGTKPEVWAAWAQALLSVVAIYFAGRFALQQHRRDLFQRVTVLVRTVGLASLTAAVNHDYLKKWKEIGSPLQTDLPYFEYLGRALHDAPLHELPDERLIHIVAGSARYSQKAFELLNSQINHNRSLYPPTETLLSEFDKCVQQLNSFMLQADRVAVDYERKLVSYPFPAYWKWRAKKKRLDSATDKAKVSTG
ncbi:hypothetical protein [Stenotrophomonas sp.]|uniref:hypothetical protein n=1 Tax=Stenotrophomonas sp. TaxID=69392 RepID=UPI0031D8A29D